MGDNSISESLSDIKISDQTIYIVTNGMGTSEMNYISNLYKVFAYDGVNANDPISFQAQNEAVGETKLTHNTIEIFPSYQVL